MPRTREHTLLLDKSTFQQLSWREHVELSRRYILNIPPILAAEILADLNKAFQRNELPERKVAEFARKFGGSGDPVNVDWNVACSASLGGEVIEMRGRTLVGHAQEVEGPDGERAILIEPSFLNLAFVRWADGNFTDRERAYAANWRARIPRMGSEALWERLRQNHILIPRPRDQSDIVPVAEHVLLTEALQTVLLEYLLDQLQPLPATGFIRDRWNATAQPRLLKYFSPYAYWCLRAQLSALVAIRHNFVRSQPSDMLDTQYLYYLPFCQHFSSSDRLHKLLAPLLISSNQRFIVGGELKADLQAAIAQRDADPAA